MINALVIVSILVSLFIIITALMIYNLPYIPVYDGKGEIMKETVNKQ